ncbi:invertase inhibitor [Canna indica]|uniref:Invertase inhibitor n=1 Tax=Canna indica TaxID=4628 RepID=A0AAQ3QA92_9LILI|nr:invertase inhibitor [Canna indica]
MSRHSLFLVLLALLIPSFSSAASPTIESACKDFVDPNFCITSLQVVNGSESADLRGLAGISLRLAVFNATGTFAKLETFKKTTTDAGVLNSVAACEILYRNAATTLQFAAEFSASNHFDLAVVMYGSILDAPVQCGEILRNGFDVDGRNFFYLMLMAREFTSKLKSS